ncbi:chromate resistance protein ChrB domain-containing protein [Dongia deserti]|uniref:chromate resistance protein ChrB domain-containing protein n=1 Tax=Dongia deserti TaxID=2268030 RepID=UPI0013C4A35B|nr:chromate resistance protein ChrB domain-containing protein [Dongia deserti]
MQWVTRQRPKIDRIACPWLITRFIDSDPKFLFVPVEDVRSVASATGAIPFDVPGVDLWHGGRGCSFDMLLAKYKLDQPALKRIAAIVRAADNDNAAVTPEAAGLRAISFGLARSIRDDQSRVAHGFMLYDALYRWAQRAEPVGRPERGVALWLSRRRERIALAELDPWLLRDLGLTPDEVDEECRKPFWRG